MDTAIRTRKTIRFKGRSFLALVIAPEQPLDDWFREFDTLRDKSPSFFFNRPLVLDVSALDCDRAGLEALIAALAERRVRVMGIEGARSSALGPGLPPGLSGGKPMDVAEPVAEAPAPVPVAAPSAARPAAEPPPPAPPPAAPAPVYAPSLVIDSPVRSGQSVMFLEGDVTIIGSVASGAEVVAGGSIHVYGALRGRALAGCIGDAKARIFAQRFEAELISIGGLYQIADELDHGLAGRAVQIRLEEDTLIMTPFDRPKD